MDALAILADIDQCFKKAMRSGLGKKGLVFPIDQSRVEDSGLKAICERLATIFGMINESYDYSEKLAQGNLKTIVSRTNIFAMPLKGLQSSLANLTWQANQVAQGDLNQSVHFLGEFSDSFNGMIDSLRQKKIVEQRLNIITKVIGEGIFLVDSEGKIIFSNPEAMKLLGYDGSELETFYIQKTIYKQHMDGRFYDPEDNLLFNAIARGEPFDDDNGAFTCKSGLLLPVMIACRPIYRDETVDGAVVAFRDITEQKKYLESLTTINELLEEQATTDPLTGIYNRMKFNDALDSEIKRAQRYRSPLSMIIFDIDHFKNVNDSYGHSAGDKVLKRITKIVSANIRETDIFARWGGEEFVIQVPGVPLEGAVRFAEKLRANIEACDFEKPNKVTSSFGVTVFEDGDTSTKLINRADEALYAAKKGGRNRVHAFQKTSGSG